MTREQIANIYHSGLNAIIALVIGLFEKIAELEREVKTLKAKLASLEREVETLKAKLASFEKDSTNSNKPPSSDGLRKERGSPERGSSGRKPGGQKEHVGKARPLAPPEEVSRTVSHRPSVCKECGEVFWDATPCVVVERRQVFEIPEIKPTVTEHVFYQLTCSNGHQTREPVADWIMSGAGERPQGLISYLTAVTKLVTVHHPAYCHSERSVAE